MNERPDDAYRLQAQAERLQVLAMRQQDVILKLRQLASDEHEIMNIWESLDEPDAASQAWSIENQIRELTTRLMDQQHQIIDRIATATAEAIKTLRITRR